MAVVKSFDTILATEFGQNTATFKHLSHPETFDYSAAAKVTVDEIITYTVGTYSTGKESVV